MYIHSKYDNSNSNSNSIVQAEEDSKNLTKYTSRSESRRFSQGEVEMNLNQLNGLRKKLYPSV